MSAALTQLPIAVRRPALPAWVGRVGWAVLSIGLFAAIWEACWALGWADKRLLPPPHIFLGNVAEQAKFFNTINRWQVGQQANAGPPPAMAVFYTASATIINAMVGGDRDGQDSSATPATASTAPPHACQPGA